MELIRHFLSVCGNLGGLGGQTTETVGRVGVRQILQGTYLSRGQNTRRWEPLVALLEGRTNCPRLRRGSRCGRGVLAGEDWVANIEQRAWGQKT